MKSVLIIALLFIAVACTVDVDDNVDDPESDQGITVSPQPEIPERPVPEDYFCNDSDEGIDILTEGVVTSDQGTFSDACQDNNKLIEYYCDGIDVDRSIRRCTQGPCVDGACTIEPEESLCVDSDGGSFYDIFGIATGFDNKSKADYCNYFDIAEYKTINCDVCVDGVCVQEEVSAEIEGCVDSDGGVWYDVKGTTVDAYDGNGTDYCISSELIEEYYCDVYGLVNSKTYRCACADGVCVGTA